MGCKQTRDIDEHEHDHDQAQIEANACFSGDLFVEKQEMFDKYQCPIMWGVLNNPVRSECGHVFCQRCIITSISMDPRRRCPICRQNLGKLKKDTNTTKKILGSAVNCAHAECDWTGKLRHLSYHLRKDCKCEAPKCRSCNKAFQSIKELTHHRAKECPFRVIPCIHCSCPIIANRMSNHWGHCAFRSRPCNQCGQCTTRINFEEHKQACSGHKS